MVKLYCSFHSFSFYLFFILLSSVLFCLSVIYSFPFCLIVLTFYHLCLSFLSLYLSLKHWQRCQFFLLLLFLCISPFTESRSLTRVYFAPSFFPSFVRSFVRSFVGVRTLPSLSPSLPPPSQRGWTEDNENFSGGVGKTSTFLTNKWPKIFIYLGAVAKLNSYRNFKSKL